MHFLAALTLLSTALAVPFQHLRRATGTEYPTLPMPTGTGTAPGTVPTGGSTVGQASLSSSYHVSITYATTTTPTTPTTFATFPASIPDAVKTAKAVPNPDGAKLRDPGAHLYPTAPGPGTGTALPTGGSSGLPFNTHHSATSYSVSVVYARTSPAFAAPTKH
ncbi:hypothetical protein GGR54DRAFT_341524 [Hypoxylon sp. NC1633]|nr:hypothetical protein GGR54DRAFT_341524 [Hypoxylon sp. NC1633]